MVTSRLIERPAARPGSHHLPQSPSAILRRRRFYAAAAALVALVAGIGGAMSDDPRPPSTAASQPPWSSAPSAAAPSVSAPVADEVSARPVPARAQRPAKNSAPAALDPQAQGDGSFTMADGSSRAVGSGPPQRFAVEVEQGLGVDPDEFAAAVEDALFDKRSWAHNGFSLKRVSAEPIDFRVTLASTGTTDELCAALQTNGKYSCWNEERAVVNFMRWVKATPDYRGRVADYRRYAINHEVGHALGHGHATCPQPGAPAPLMMQQTKGVGSCRPNPWPFP